MKKTVLSSIKHDLQLKETMCIDQQQMHNDFPLFETNVAII